MRIVSGTAEMGLVLADINGVTGHICAAAFHTADAKVLLYLNAHLQNLSGPKPLSISAPF